MFLVLVVLLGLVIFIDENGRFKNIFKVVSVLLLGMAWFFFEFHLSDTDANKKSNL